jgi:DNA-binding response OmpR family regulator
MSLVLLSRDLVTASRVEGAAMRQHVSLRTVGSIELAVAACSEQSISLMIVDLTLASLDVARLVTELKQANPVPTIVAFGPHVHEAALAAARDAGCDEVMSRGQFFAQMDAVVAPSK